MRSVEGMFMLLMVGLLGLYLGLAVVRWATGVLKGMVSSSTQSFDWEQGGGA